LKRSKDWIPVSNLIKGQIWRTGQPRSTQLRRSTINISTLAACRMSGDQQPVLHARVGVDGFTCAHNAVAYLRGIKRSSMMKSSVMVFTWSRHLTTYSPCLVYFPRENPNFQVIRGLCSCNSLSPILGLVERMYPKRSTGHSSSASNYNA
jgi:hypothetical protein